MKIPKFRRSSVDDKRGRKIIAVIHCFLNQNARDLGAATHQGMYTDLVDLCARHGVGMLQLPCPEMHCLGLVRTRPKGYSIRDMLEMPFCRKALRGISSSVAEQVQEYRDNGCEVLAVIGGDVQSPGCAVHHFHEIDGKSVLMEKSGIFMQELAKEFLRRKLDIPFIGLRESNPEMLADDVAWIKDRVLDERS